MDDSRPVHAWSAVIKPQLANAADLCDGDVLLFVRSSVRSFVR